MGKDLSTTLAVESITGRRQAILKLLRVPHGVTAAKPFKRIYAPEYGTVYASAGPLYKNAIFGRDSLEVAEDSFEIAPELVKNTLLMLARLQGTKHREVSDEQPGRIHHEHRTAKTEGAKSDKELLKKFRYFSRIWGGDEESVTYYGSLDATPLYVRLACNYCLLYGNDFLDTKLTNKDGQEITIQESCIKALDWICGRLLASRIGLIEYNQANHLEYAGSHSWKDSLTAYIHKDGSLINYREGFSVIEIQAYAYDALKLAAEVFKDRDKHRAELWLDTASDLRERLFKYFWLEKEHYFAGALDYGFLRRPTPIDVITSSPGTLLDTEIFYDSDDQRKYITALIHMLFSDDMLTDAGIRCRALRHVDLMPYVDYHGSFAVWPKETYDIAKGLRKHGFSKLAEQLENRIVNSVLLAGEYYELFYVDANNHVDYDPELINHNIQNRQELIATNVPEPAQAWSISAVLAIASKRQQPKAASGDKTSWQNRLEQTILGKIKNVPMYTTLEVVEENLPLEYGFKINTHEGWHVANEHYKSIDTGI